MPTTGVECLVKVELNCELRGSLPGVSCDLLESPTTNQCAAASILSEVTFSFQNCTCDDSANNQGAEALCDDHAGIDFTEPVTVSFTDSETAELC